jgi:hypothetical protein
MHVHQRPVSLGRTLSILSAWQRGPGRYLPARAVRAMSRPGKVRPRGAATRRHRLGPLLVQATPRRPCPGDIRPPLARRLIPYRRDFYYIAHSKRQSATSGNSIRLPVPLRPYGPVWVPCHASRATILSPAENKISIAGDQGSSHAVLIPFARSGTPAANPLARAFSPKISCARETFPAHPSEPAANHVNATFTIGSTGHASSFPRTSQ